MVWNRDEGGNAKPALGLASGAQPTPRTVSYAAAVAARRKEMGHHIRAWKRGFAVLSLLLSPLVCVGCSLTRPAGTAAPIAFSQRAESLSSRGSSQRKQFQSTADSC